MAPFPFHHQHSAFIELNVWAAKREGCCYERHQWSKGCLYRCLNKLNALCRVVAPAGRCLFELNVDE
ncbi:hypothetical protein T07_1445 [Trichinella nelsoni]|uniref:Uncharacterized protein n=1 Tax=Trichinella nelsoni TaxID=6336 RepID=A0A0V0SBJ2_9BILA|nr:hypothetical protein T07_1445 [Trichinella nelsoni]